MSETKDNSDSRIARLKRVAPFLLLIAVLIAAYALGLQRYVSFEAFLDSRAALKEFVAAHLFTASLSFVCVYAVLVAVAFPAASLFTVAGGFLFGWLLGGALVVVGATLGAVVLFLAARFAFGDILKRKAGGAIWRFADGFRADAFSYLFVLRLTPVLPFFAVNIAPAFFDVSLRTYALATFLGIMPGAMVYAFLGSGLNQTLANLGHGSIGIGDLATPQTTIALVGLAGLALVGVVLKKTFLRRSTVEDGGEA